MSHTIQALFSAIPHTFTVAIYSGKTGTHGFEGTVTCHAVQFKDHMTLWLLHRCSRIVR